MSRRFWRQIKLCLLLVSVVAIVWIFIGTFKTSHTDNISVGAHRNMGRVEYEFHEGTSKHYLCVIIPFRDRFVELMEFAPYMHNFLNTQHVKHKLFVIHQVDTLRFNRASLINIGYQLSLPHCDYIGMHDVDLLPLNPKLDYGFPANGPMHIAAPNLHPKYHYKNFVGGILLLTMQHFLLANGLSNRFWGWGREDDEFFLRMRDAKLQLHRPQNISTGYNTFRHIHDKKERARDYSKYGEQKKMSRQRDHKTGITDIQYHVKAMRDITIDGAPLRLVDVELVCDLNVTIWCIHPEQLDTYIKHKSKKNNEDSLDNNVPVDHTHKKIP